MKSSKTNGLGKLVSFIVLAVLLICTVGFAVSGWQEPNKEPDSGDNGNTAVDTDGNTNGNPPDNSTTLPDDTSPEPEAPKFYSQITGLEITEAQYNTTPLGFVVDPSAPIYGLSTSEVAFEFPIENGKTRMLSYTTNTSILWKIGSLVATRNYISGMSNFFGGVVISNGNDDIVKYSAWDTSKIDLDISKYSECYYIENTLYIYTGKDYVNTALNSAENLNKAPYKEAQFSFAEGEEIVRGPSEAKTVTIPYSSSETSLYYSEQSGKYLLFKSQNRKVDMLTGQNISFTNVFILFANATTYEKSDGTELVIDTISGGKGYYISNGTLTEIRWNVDENGSLSFKSLSGEALKINRGNSYFSYFKASESSKVVFH